MYSEQLAVLLFIAATQMANQGATTQPMAQVPRGGVERVGLHMKMNPRLSKASQRHGMLRPWQYARIEPESTRLAAY
ncbi:MAG: hypothetical protein B7Y41_09135 [Hydrogenophilales bacterium 28-61-23]|nr:MAG: hypothetical protein B7Y41_09135 [Hydrogenophilales bacterium 28-61-23]